MKRTLTRQDFLGLAASGVSGVALGGVGLGRDAAGAQVASGNCPSTPDATLKRQLRGVWIATVENIDWPSEPGLSPREQRQEFERLMAAAAAMNLNAIVVQVRPAADAFYPSELAPWSEYLTGVPGEDPGYDPLSFMIGAAHRRNLEFHAWFNPYRVSLQNDRNRLAPKSPAREHPDWVVEYGGQLYFDPGIPDARRLVEQSVLEVVENYDVDAVHFDDYFYPYPVADESFPDEDSYQKYGASRFDDVGDWRRDNVNSLIRELSTEIKRVKAWVKFGISPFGVWRNKGTDPTGSETTAGAQTYDDLYADTRNWIQNSWLDYVAPQIYWSIGFEPAAYDVLVPWWSREVEKTGVHLYIGQAAYKIANNNAAWDDPEEMPNHLRFNRSYPEVGGDIYFSMRSLLANPLGFADRLSHDLYRYEAFVPVMPRLGGDPPNPPALRDATPSRRGIELEWFDPRINGAAYYAIYRFEKTDTGACGFHDPQNIVDTARRSQNGSLHFFTDTSSLPPGTYTYHVSALDRLHHESPPSEGRSVRL